MTTQYDAETTQRLFDALGKYKDATRVSLKEFSHETMNEVKQEILDALPVIKKWYEMDETNPEWDIEEFTQAICAPGDPVYTGVRDAAWSLIMRLSRLSEESISAVAFARHVDGASYNWGRMVYWLNYKAPQEKN